jgi:hypothetical protein
VIRPAAVQPVIGRRVGLTPGELYRTLVWLEERSPGGWLARRAADRARVSTNMMLVVLDGLAVLGILTVERAPGGTARYRLAAAPAPLISGGRTVAPVSGMELWAAIRRAAPAGTASTEKVAAELDAPVGRADRTWLALRLALHLPTGRLALVGGGWQMTAAGHAYTADLRRGRIPTSAAVPAIAAETARAGGEAELEAVARRLGVGARLLSIWVEDAADNGLIVDSAGRLMLTGAGRARLGL